MQSLAFEMLDRRQTLIALASLAFAEGARADPQVRPDLAKPFADLDTNGVFAALNRGTLVVSDAARATDAKLPASTFKIPNSLIALETGVVSHPDTDVFKWDGVTRSIAAWNRDHTMRTAIAASAVPVYQEIARRIGADRMQRFVDLFGYGNRDIGGGIDQFWLTGNLRISPLEQIAFVDRLRTLSLPISQRSQRLVRDILPVTKADEATIHAKSGLLGAEIDKPSLGWLVGWAEKGASQTVFALNLDVRNSSHIAARAAISQKCLQDIGAI